MTLLTWEFNMKHSLLNFSFSIIIINVAIVFQIYMYLAELRRHIKQNLSFSHLVARSFLMSFTVKNKTKQKRKRIRIFWTVPLITGGMLKQVEPRQQLQLYIGTSSKCGSHICWSGREKVRLKTHPPCLSISLISIPDRSL